MKTFFQFTFIFILLGFSLKLSAGAGFYEDEGANQRQKVVFDFGNGDEWKSVVDDVDGHNYGSKKDTDKWLLKGGEGFVYKDNGSDITKVWLNYSIYKDGDTPSFTGIELIYDTNVGGNNQRWATTGSNVDIIAAVTSPGIWHVEFYYLAETNGNNCPNPVYFNKSGDNYKLQFTADASFPVELSNFTGSLKKEGILLKWTTASEQNTKSYTIERSATGKGNFIAIGKVDAAGNSVEKLDYSFTDNTPLPFNYYRLQTTDLNGRFQVSKIIMIKNAAANGIINIYPIPTKNTITLSYRINTGNDMTLTITDLDGRMMKTMQFVAQKGDNSQNIDIQELASGVYLLHLNDGASIHTSKIIKN